MEKPSLRTFLFLLAVGCAVLLPWTKWLVLYSLGRLWSPAVPALILLPVLAVSAMAVLIIAEVLLWRSLRSASAGRFVLTTLPCLVLAAGLAISWCHREPGSTAYNRGLVACAKRRLNYAELQEWVRLLERVNGVCEKPLELGVPDLPAQLRRLGNPSTIAAASYSKPNPEAVSTVGIVWGSGFQSWALHILADPREPPRQGSSRFYEIAPGLLVVSD